MFVRSGGGADAPTKERSRRRLARVRSGLNKTRPGRRRVLLWHNGAFATPTYRLIHVSHLRDSIRMISSCRPTGIPGLPLRRHAG